VKVTLPASNTGCRVSGRVRLAFPPPWKTQTGWFQRSVATRVHEQS
jgi:hypothetical protein